MSISVTREAFVFLSSALAGAGIFLLYDLFRLLRKAAGAGKLLTHIQDGVFWILALCLLFFVIFDVNNGIVRFYELLGAALGATIYGLTLSGPIFRIFEAILHFFSQFFKVFFKILLTPLIFTYNIVNRCISFALRPVIKLYRRSNRKLLEHLKKTHRFIRKK